MKSCVLLAGLYAADGPTVVVEPAPTRDHTERMLEAAGARVRRRPGEAAVWPAERLHPLSLRVPGDISSAAPFLVAATLLPGSELRLHGIGVNPTRTGLLDVLERMGARISLYDRRTEGGEPVADLEVQASELTATEIEPARGAAPRRRAAAVRARGGDGAGQECRQRRAGAAREGVGPNRDA